jgi:hypothetical protein
MSPHGCAYTVRDGENKADDGETLEEGSSKAKSLDNVNTL